VTNNDREVVTALRAKLADKVGKERYELWFGANTKLAVHGGILTVCVPNQFYQDWLRSHFRKDLEASCMEALGQPLALEFRISPSEAAAVAPSTPDSPSGPTSGSAPPSAVKRPAIASVALTRTPASQRRFACLSAFVVGDNNCLAHKSAQMAAQKPGSLSPLMLHGPTGVGKTHLLEGIWSAFKQTHRQSTAIYLSAEQFTSYFLEALHGSGLPSFRRKYRDVELLVIDDVQFFSGKRATLGELLHTIDTLLRQGRQLVLAADRSPAALAALGPELMARLAGGMTCRIEPPEYATRLGIVRQDAARLGLSVPDEVLAYIASHLTSHARQLSGALKRLHAMSLAHDRPVTLSSAEEALSDLVQAGASAVRLPDIEKAICEVFGLDRASLQSSRKSKSISYPRMLAMFLARKHTRAALSEIGHFFGRRSHSTVISAQKKVSSLMSKGAPLKLAERSWNLEEVIRRVEDCLRAG